jgi:DNA modification methylase
MSMSGGIYLNRACHTVQHWKPVVWYQNGGKLGKYLGDIIYSDRVPSKELHGWQQSLVAFENLVKTHTIVGDLVYDPFVGSGTTGVACVRHRRKFVGSDADEKCVQMTVKRLRETKPAKYVKVTKLLGG